MRHDAVLYQAKGPYVNTEKQTGRLIGGLLLAAMLLGLWNNFGLTQAIFSGAGWLKNGAQMPLSFGGGALLGVLTSAMGLAAAILAWPVLRQTSPALALAYLMLTAVVLATSSMEQANFLSLRSLSLQYANHPELDPAQFDIMRSMVMANRNWIHFIDKILGGASMFMLYLALFRSGLVPRFIPAFGLLAALSQMCGISLELFLQDLPILMLAPLALTQLVLCLTLLARGFSPTAVERR